MRKIRLIKDLLIEITETLCTICIYLEQESRVRHHLRSEHFRMHFEELKRLSDELKGERK